MLVLGVETCVGQQFYNDLQKKFPQMTVATLAKRYGAKVDLPTHFVPVDFEDHAKLCQAFSLSRAVVACDMKYVNERVKRAAKAAEVAFIESVPRSQLLIEGALEEAQFKPEEMVVHEIFCFSFGCVSGLLRAKQLGLPSEYARGEWTIDEDVISLGDPVGLKVPVRCEFVHWLWAWIIWLFIFVMRIFAGIVPGRLINGEHATGSKTPVTCRYICNQGQFHVRYANEIALQSGLLLIKTIRKVIKNYHGQLPQLCVAYVERNGKNSSRGK